jgi:beta-glucanase (GH16 family)
MAARGRRPDRARRHVGRVGLAAVLGLAALPVLAGATLAVPPAARASVLHLSPAVPRAAAVQAVAPQAGAGLLAAKKKSSWKTERTEEFSGSSLPEGCGAYSGKYTAGKSAWSSKAVDVSNGLLKLTLRKKKTSGKPYTSGGIGCWDWAQKYGRFEVKAKVPEGRGIDSYMTLWPVKGGAGAWTGMELLAPGPDTAYITNGYGTKAEGARVPGTYGGAFHTYVIEWAPKHLRMTVDGDEIFYSTRSYKGSRWLGLVTSNGDALTGVPDAATKLPATFQIDRIKISSYTGVAPKARESSLTTSRSQAAGEATPAPVPTPAATLGTKTPPTPARVTTTLKAEPTAQTGPALAGGVWPWLLGGSLIAVLAIASLNYPHHRRAQKAAKEQRAREQTVGTRQ